MKINSKNSNPEDIIQLILNDHVELKRLIKILKSEDSTYLQKQKAFKEFAPKLEAHAKPEERTWYVSLKTQDHMRVEGLEGDIEHGVADMLCQELKIVVDHDVFMAGTKVLAELVEHHIKEEEEDVLPAFHRQSTVEERIELGFAYLGFQMEVEAMQGATLENLMNEGKEVFKQVQKQVLDGSKNIQEVVTNALPH